MYKRLIGIALLILAALSLAYGAERLPRHIAPSFAGTRNIIEILTPTHPINVGRFTSSLKGNTIYCRPKNNIKPPLLSSFKREMRIALVDDLMTEKLYQIYATSYINGNVDKIYFNAGDFNDGYWVIQMTFYGETKSGKFIQPFTIKTKKYYNMSTTEHHYCPRVAEYFGGAVRAFVAKLFSSPQFKEIITS